MVGSFEMQRIAELTFKSNVGYVENGGDGKSSSMVRALDAIRADTQTSLENIDLQVR